eukprot:9467134-Pyramimonas_sp.AAC.1
MSWRKVSSQLPGWSCYSLKNYYYCNGKWTQAWCSQGVVSQRPLAKATCDAGGYSCSHHFYV